MKSKLDEWWNGLTEYQKQCLKDFVDVVEKGLKKINTRKRKQKF